MSVQLGEPAHNLDVSPTQLVEALDGAPARLNSAYEALAMVDNRSDGIFDNRSTGQWWDRRLASSLPFAVLETDADPLIVWASVTVGPPANPVYVAASAKFAQNVDACGR